MALALLDLMVTSVAAHGLAARHCLADAAVGAALVAALAGDVATAGHTALAAEGAAQGGRDGLGDIAGASNDDVDGLVDLSKEAAAELTERAVSSLAQAKDLLAQTALDVAQGTVGVGAHLLAGHAAERAHLAAGGAGAAHGVAGGAAGTFGGTTSAGLGFGGAAAMATVTTHVAAVDAGLAGLTAAAAKGLAGQLLGPGNASTAAGATIAARTASGAASSAAL